MLSHLDGLARTSPHLPDRRPGAAALPVAASGVFHTLTAIFFVLALGVGRVTPPATPATANPLAPIAANHFIFIASDATPRGGGGGGGNRQAGPIRRAEDVGRDAITLRVARAAAAPDDAANREPRPAVLLDARPLAAGTRDVIGLPDGAVSAGASRGPGSDGGAGDGAGPGLGSGEGPGVDRGTGGGTGDGVYRLGGQVSPPRAVVQVKPKYTSDAMMRKVQGTTMLEFVVTADGRADDIHVVRSLDPGLDDQAIIAAKQWRFEPGRLGGKPVAVLVTLVLDFNLR